MKRFLMFTKPWAVLLLVVLIAGGTISCKKDDDDNNPAPSETYMDHLAGSSKKNWIPVSIGSSYISEDLPNGPDMSYEVYKEKALAITIPSSEFEAHLKDCDKDDRIYYERTGSDFEGKTGFIFGATPCSNDDEPYINRTIPYGTFTLQDKMMITEGRFPPPLGDNTVYRDTSFIHEMTSSRMVLRSVGYRSLENYPPGTGSGITRHVIDVYDEVYEAR